MEKEREGRAKEGEGDQKKGKEVTQISDLMMCLKALENKNKQHPQIVDRKRSSKSRLKLVKQKQANKNHYTESTKRRFDSLKRLTRLTNLYPN